MANYPVISRQSIPNAGDITTDVTNFNNILSSSDIDVQQALDTIDNLNIYITPISIKTSSYTVTSSDYTIIADSSTQAVTINLTATPITGQTVIIKCKNQLNGVTVGRNGKNIDGEANDITLYDDEVVRLQYDGTEWWII